MLRTIRPTQSDEVRRVSGKFSEGLRQANKLRVVVEFYRLHQLDERHVVCPGIRPTRSFPATPSYDPLRLHADRLHFFVDRTDDQLKVGGIDLFLSRMLVVIDAMRGCEHVHLPNNRRSAEAGRISAYGSDKRPVSVGCDMTANYLEDRRDFEASTTTSSFSNSFLVK